MAAPLAAVSPDDDESCRGTCRFGPALLVALLSWAALLLLLVL